MTESQRRWATATADRAVAAEKRKLELAAAGAAKVESAGEKIRKIKDDAAAKMRKEREEKEKTAEARKAELMR